MLGHGTYLLFELTWAVPVIAIQWLAGPRCLRASRRLLLLTIGAATLYLSLIDAFAIANGIWTISPQRTLGLSFGPLPLEEAIFFLVTNAMVVQSIVLLRSEEPRQRIKRLFAHGS
ncbi:MAG: lycopene cyclase domain-containing protein [Chloroflexota bacterium]